MSLRDAMRVATSGLTMQRARMEVIASNLANAHTTRTAEGGPYLRKLPLVRPVSVGDGSFDAELGRAVQGVRVVGVRDDTRPPLLKYEPGHPDADAKGYVAYPNVNPAEEMTDMLSAVRSYEASTNVVKTVQRMHESALSIIR